MTRLDRTIFKELSLNHPKGVQFALRASDAQFPLRSQCCFPGHSTFFSSGQHEPKCTSIPQLELLCYQVILMTTAPRGIVPRVVLVVRSQDQVKIKSGAVEARHAHL